ncbi:DNA topoisomerase 6 subunit B [Candidatus Lokiarchaeum ossiferum]|uniref:DNA topoisomerase 6 subunit B n=1 Tax=Candidatus Lokiarchaeum ossiferum TaxID=2951803 RepID=A0ABY6HPU1_9ARCH|nr:DNA topoisomerase 6 subunit B [Candidatus Lokiarchaeum sp. B-35]
MAKKETKSQESGTIKQGSVAEFFRKRTQLVGFDFGLNKFTQYCIEFVDNSLDALENFHWKESKKHQDYAFKLKDDLILENFSYFIPVFEEDIQEMESKLESEMVDDEGNKLSEDGELIIELEDEEENDESLVIDEEEKLQTEETADSDEDDEEAKNIRKLQKKADELESEVQNIMYGIDGFLYPIKAMVEREPFVIFQLTEREAQDVYADASSDSKEVFEYTLDVFDNGTGMSPGDLEKFGRYLASSKSQKLKQTRGSQGFGSPSAFSDAQNTTGQPVTVVSKDINHIYATCSQFYTTSKNSKEYIVPPTEVTSIFEHGTFISLNFLNVKYRKGYIDSYIQQTALTNPHITIIFLDPNGEEEIYPRRVKNFPREPTYALPHPSSVNIGDFQDQLRSSENLTVSAFLQDNYVRMSSTIAKKIVKESEEELEQILSLLNLESGYLTWRKNPGPIYFAHNEQRIHGRSKKPRDTLVIYEVKDEEDLAQYWGILKVYNKKLDSINKKSNKIRKLQKSIMREVDKKQIKTYKKEISGLEKEIASIEKENQNLKKTLSKAVKTFKFLPQNEVKDSKITDKLEDDVKEVMTSKAHPYSLTQKQTESLYKAFKAQKYMAPPSDPAVPIGGNILETTMLKEFNLNPAHRTDLFIQYEAKLEKLTSKESEIFPQKILSRFIVPPYLDPEFSSEQMYKANEELNHKSYADMFLKYDMVHTQDDDFIMGYTRSPTSGKGLAFVVEAVIAISPKIPSSKQAQQVLMRYVNRTPKMRDNSDCAIWKGVQSVNWKNYKLDTFDNGIPKGNIRMLVNVSGPYVHLMFKSQSKNALAEDEVLLKEIKYCLEAIGRKIRQYQNKRTNRENSRKRSKVIEKFVPIFVSSLLEVATTIDAYKDLKAAKIEQRILDRLEGKIKKTPEEIEEENSRKEQEDKDRIILEKIRKQQQARKREVDKEISSQKKDENSDDEVEVSDESESPRKEVKITLSEKIAMKPRSADGPKPVRTIDDILSKAKTHSKSKVSSKTKSSTRKSTKKVLKVKGTKAKKLESKSPTSDKTIPKEPIKVKKSPPAPSAKKLVKPQSKINIISADGILKKLPEDEWLNIKDLIRILEIKDLKDARFLQLKLKQLTREKRLLISIKGGKTFWKLNKK